MITLIGSEGSMGKRYQAILRELAILHTCFDKQHSLDQIKEFVAKSQGVIIATPTDTHYDFLMELLPFRKKILCEKPITKNMTQLSDLYKFCKVNDFHFTTMMQYTEIPHSRVEGCESNYDYFRTGPDGLPWDCLQVIAMARGPIHLDNKSPVWKCMINGRTISIADMDKAYVSFVLKWINGLLKEDPQFIWDAHVKAAEIA